MYHKLFRHCILLVCISCFTVFAFSKAQGQSAATETEATEADTVDAILADTVHLETLSISQLIRNNQEYFHTLQRGISRLQHNMEEDGIEVDIVAISTVVDRIIENFYSNEIELNLQYLSELDNLLSGYSLAASRWRNEVESRAETFARIGEDIEDIRTTYESAQSMVDSSALPALNEQWDALLTRLVRADSLYNIQNVQNLDMLSRLTGLIVSINDVKDEIRERQRAIQSGFFEKDAPFIWQIRSLRDLGDLLPIVKESIVLNRIILKSYLSRNAGTIAWILVLGLLTYIWYATLLRKVREEKDFSGLILDRSQFLVRSPLACSILSILTLAPYIFSYPPNGVVLTILLAMTGATTYLIKPVLKKRIFQIWLFFAFSLFVFGISNLIIERATPERWYLVLFTIGGLALAYYVLWLTRNKRKQYPSHLTYLVYLYIAMQGASLLSYTFGRFSMAKVLAVASTMSLVQAISLYVFVSVVMEAIYLQTEVLQGNKRQYTNFLNYRAINRSLGNFFSLLGIIMWSYFLALNLSVDDLIYDWFAEFLSSERLIGSTTFTFGSILVFVLVIWLSTVLAKNIAYFISMRDSHKANTRDKRLGSFVLLIRLAVLIIGFFIALAFSGISLDNLTIILGGLSVGIAFGLQTIVNNLASGIILAFERPIQIGDAIEVGARSGVVKEIGIRSSTIQAYDGSEVIIPNGDLLSQHLINWTLSDRKRRVEVVVGVAYGSNLKLVRETLAGILAKNEILPTPPPRVFLHNLADSAVEFRMLFWVSNLDTWVETRNQVLTDTYEAFNAAGIEIPFPQHDIHVYQKDPDASSSSKTGNENPAKEGNTL